jgi:hypothetical protein
MMHIMKSIGINPCAGLGVNTIRVWSAKYRIVLPGDFVNMQYFEIGADPKKDEYVMWETLRVASVSIAEGVLLVKYHLAANHAFGKHRALENAFEDADTFFRWTYGDEWKRRYMCAIYFQ